MRVPRVGHIPLRNGKNVLPFYVSRYDTGVSRSPLVAAGIELFHPLLGDAFIASTASQTNGRPLPPERPQWESNANEPDPDLARVISRASYQLI